MFTQKRFTSSELELLKTALKQPQVQEYLCEENRLYVKGKAKWKDGTLVRVQRAMQQWIDDQLAWSRVDGEDEKSWRERVYAAASCDDCKVFAARKDEDIETYMERYKELGSVSNFSFVLH